MLIKCKFTKISEIFCPCESFIYQKVLRQEICRIKMNRRKAYVNIRCKK